VALALGFLWPVSAQFTDLTAPGHGDAVYYALQIPHPVPDFYHSPSASPIYKAGSTPPALFISFPAPVFPPNGIYSTNVPWFISPYYLVSHPQFSRDGGVLAWTGKRVCLGGLGCSSVTTTQTTVQGPPGQATLTFEGTGWLSGNGRYLLLRPDGLLSGQPVWIDLQTGQRQTLPVYVSADPYFDYSNSGRVVADDGTAVLNGCEQDSLCVFHGGQLTQSLPIGAMEPVIDAAARTVIYTSATASHSGTRYLRMYDITAGEDRLFLQANGAIYSPAIAADGKRVLFLSTVQWGTSNPPGAAQLYATNLDGTGFQELTSGSEPAGVQRYAMSDDGQVAWYLSGDGNLVKLDLSSGQTARTIIRPPAVDLSSTLVPGSAVTLPGAGLTDAVYGAPSASPLPIALGRARVILNGAPAPLLSVSPDSIVFQVPWEIPAGQPVVEQVVTNAGTAAESTVQGTVTPVSSLPALVPDGPCQANGCDLGGGAIHQDWSGYVTPNNPALPGEVIHFYGTGFGAVQPAAATGMSALANPSAVVPAMPVCTSDPGGPAAVVYLGLAPGMVGYYQMDVQLPTVFSSSHPTENRTYDQFYLDCGVGVVAVFAIKTK